MLSYIKYVLIFLNNIVDCLPLVTLDDQIAGQSNPPIDGQKPSSEAIILVETNNEGKYE